MEIIQWFQAHLLEIAAIYGGIVTVASIIVKLTPTPKDDAVLSGVIAFVSKWLALNPDGKKK